MTLDIFTNTSQACCILNRHYDVITLWVFRCALLMVGCEIAKSRDCERSTPSEQGGYVILHGESISSVMYSPYEGATHRVSSCVCD